MLKAWLPIKHKPRREFADIERTKPGAHIEHPGRYCLDSMSVNHFAQSSLAALQS
jgi:hypothetical protein